jgi:hypothetical protein
MKMPGALLISVSLAIGVPAQAAWQDSPCDDLGDPAR